MNQKGFMPEKGSFDDWLPLLFALEFVALLELWPGDAVNWPLLPLGPNWDAPNPVSGPELRCCA